MNAWLKRLPLSFIVTLSLAAHKLPAQAPLVPPSQPFDSSPSSPLMAILSRPPEPPIRTATPWLNSHGFCCDSHLTWYGCGGLRANHDFIFGSCRTFFGEICIPKAPHSSTHQNRGQQQHQESSEQTTHPIYRGR
jgi:hypothetical protein